MTTTRKIVIADGGSTKCKWAVVSACPEDVKCATYLTCGVNPLQLGEDDIVGLWQGDDSTYTVMCDAEAVFYYGAGCIGGVANERIAGAIRRLTGIGEVNVFSDMVGAARGVLGSRSGVACILGTGCNSCLYDGRDIVSNIRPLGYILGDEGSGADIGKHLVADALKGILPRDLTDKFYAFAGADYADIIRHIYNELRANAYLASFARFVAQNIIRPEMQDLVRDRFSAFLRRNVLLYGADALNHQPVGFTGGIASQFEDILRGACQSAGLTDIVITSDPLDGLVDYHVSHL